MESNKLPMKQAKKIALVAHDNKKRDLLEWAGFNRDLLPQHDLYATATTGRLLKQELDLEVTTLQSGPLGCSLTTCRDLSGESPDDWRFPVHQSSLTLILMP